MPDMENTHSGNLAANSLFTLIADRKLGKKEMINDKYTSLQNEEINHSKWNVFSFSSFS